METTQSEEQMTDEINQSDLQNQTQDMNDTPQVANETPTVAAPQTSYEQSDPNHIKLGGNIELIGFADVEASKMIVVKKMAGTYMRKMTDAGTEPLGLVITKDGEAVNAVLKLSDKELKGDDSNANIFFGMDKALAKVLEQIN